MEPEDLRVLAYMTTYRVPPHVHQEMHEIIPNVEEIAPHLIGDGPEPELSQ